MIIDCHVHIADHLTGFRQPLRYGKVLYDGETQQWLPPSFDPTASPPEIVLGYMDQAGVDRAFLVQHHQYGDQNDSTLQAVRRWPDRFVGFATLNAMDQPDDPDRLERLIEAGLLGLKVELYSTRRLRPDFRFDGELEWRVWERLDKLKAPLVIDANGGAPEDTEAMRQVIESLSHLRVSICHAGGPSGRGWQERALLGRHPRVWVDLASLPTMSGPETEYPFPEAQELVKWVTENVGWERTMWGTDYPPVLNRATYRQYLDYIRRHCQFLSREQKDRILGGAAQAFISGA